MSDGLGDRLALVQERIAVAQARSSRSAANVGVLAVTKGFGDEVVQRALAGGLVDLGENYAQELLAKAERVHAPAGAVRWHMIGQLQRNKVRQLAGTVSLWQSVDRESLGREIARRAPGAAVLVQCNLSGESHRGGCELSEAPALVEALRGHGLQVQGLMGVGPAGEPEASRPGFAALVALADDLGLQTRSIGMSADLEVAVEEGSTLVRVGTALFGDRPPRPVAGAADAGGSGSKP